jgi:hypothetical protein
MDGTDNQEQPDLGEQLEELGDDIRDYVEKHSPRPAVDVEIADRLLDETPPAEAADQLKKMVAGFESGGGAASGKRSFPVPGEPPTEELDDLKDAEDLGG